MSIVVKAVHFVRRVNLRFHKYYLSRALAKCGSSLNVHGKIWVIFAKRISVGSEVHLNHGCVINALEPILIGNRCQLSAYSQLHAGGLEPALEKRSAHISASIVLEDDVWIGANAIILSGVVIGTGSIVAAGAVVNKSIPSGELWGGVPARCIKKIT